MTQFFSTKNRHVHLGPYPLEKLARTNAVPDLSRIPAMQVVSFDRSDQPESIVNAMGEYQAMLDAIRDGLVNKATATCPSDPVARTEHLKSFGYFSDSTMIGTCTLPDSCHLEVPFRNPDIDRLAETLRTQQTKTLAAGIDLIMADLKESMEAPPTRINDHTHAIVFLVEYPRDPDIDEPGTNWIIDAQSHRACLRAAETATVIANYIRLLGFQARAHTGSSTDVDLNQLSVAAGLTVLENGCLSNPFIGDRYGLAAITTTFALEADKPLAGTAQQPTAKMQGLGWKLGQHSLKNARNHVPYAKRRYVDGAHPFEKLKRVDTPTTYIDEDHVARVPKRADMFARAQFGDLGKTAQEGAKNGQYVRKAAPSAAQRRALGAFVLIQNGEAAETISSTCSNAEINAQNIKAAAYFLGVDAVGISRCPDWTWYSHDARGDPIAPPHNQAISIIIDQGFETMEGASGDDWIAVAQSMRAYLRFSLLGGVMAKHIRNLGFSAKSHTVLDGEVLQPPLLLLAGLGEVSRIGEVILNPFLGPRLKSGVVTTNMPVLHDKPIDFGLQTFCESCNKCARECPSGAITAGPKLMFNGYEIWKSDSQKCTTYRIGTMGGAMCGRCMKTCPWNLEGLFVEKPFRWTAMNVPRSAKILAKLDDMVGHGEINPVKKWWWDLEYDIDGAYKPTEHPVNVRALQKNLKIRYEEQTLAVYPAHLAPPPWPYPYPMDREKGIEAYQAMITAEEYQARMQTGDANTFIHQFAIPEGEPPVIQVVVSRVVPMTPEISLYEFSSIDGSTLPIASAGAHIDIVIAPDYLRQYSLSGDPADSTKYQIGVLREDPGSGGSQLMHRIFNEGRRIFISKPINHFGLVEEASHTLLLGAGIGVTPLIAMAHRLHTIGASFELHYSVKNEAVAGYMEILNAVPWRKNLHLHISEKGSRLDLKKLLIQPSAGTHLYTCGPERYIASVLKQAEDSRWPEEQIHHEYFTTPELPEYVNHEFELHLAQSNKHIKVSAKQSAADALNAAGIPIDVKCADGLCGVCKCTLIDGDVEHRDFVLSKSQRKHEIILCQSRASKPDGVLTLDL